MLFAILFAIVVAVFALHQYLTRVHHFAVRLKSVPLLGYNNPVFGHVIFFIKTLSNGLSFPELLTQLAQMVAVVYRKQQLLMIWVGWQPMVLVFTPETVEPVLSNNNELSKSQNYDYLHPWLGTGLLTATGGKWRSRRKLLTPAFHFKILDDFIPIFNEQSKVLIRRMSQVSYIDDIIPYISTCTLDIICQTAMGTTVNAQQNPRSEYVEAIYFLGESFMQRQVWPHMWWTPIFRMTSYGKKYYRALEVLHRFTHKVMQEKKSEMRSKTQNNVNSNHEDELGIKKRKAFLDLLLEYNQDGAGLSEEDIREEVDTFMFEGHDTTSMGICWSLYLIALDSKIQAKVHEEIDSIFGDDKERSITTDDLADMKYLECCIKEGLRLFPSVPLIARELDTDVNVIGYDIPKGTTIGIMVGMVHRNPQHFPNPEVYDPDRFLPENVIGRHPYCYIPFSAGPRNCIGQKFALMEEKILLAQIFRNFQVESLDTREHIPFAIELVLRPKAPFRIRLRKRNHQN